MVTFITDKLQKQKLDDVQFEPISFERQFVESSWRLQKEQLPAGTHHLAGEKDWTPFMKNSDHRRPQSTDGSFTFLQESTDVMYNPSLSQPAAATTVSMPGDQRSHSVGAMLPPLPSRGVGDQRGRSHSGDQQRRSLGAMLPHVTVFGEGLKSSAHCLHNKLLVACTVCEDLSPGTPPHDPPKKRLCRSKSIPGDSACGAQWQPKASSIWKPIGHHRTHHNSKHVKSRNSPLVLHKPKACRASPAGSAGNHSNQTVPGSYGSRYSPGGVFKFFGSADNVATPSESPVPRPASASSGFYDSSASQTSLNTSWTEGCFNSQGCFSPHPPRTAFSKNRSLSNDGPISWSNQNLSTLSNQNSASSGSMPMIYFTGNPGISSVPSSPRRNRVPRCRSQPCVLNDRKHGSLKRRRDNERPAIDFEKMTESFKNSVSSTSSVHCSRPKSVTFAQEIQEIGNTRSLSSLYPDCPDLQGYHVLDTIASSPLDSQPVQPLAAHVAPTRRIAAASFSAKVAAPTNNPCRGQGHQNRGHCLDMSQATQGRNQSQTLVHDFARSQGQIMLADPEERSQGAHVPVEEIQWDSGCSDTNDPPDLLSFGESETSYDDNSVLNDEDTSQQFELEMGNEIDLEQIEKD